MGCLKCNALKINSAKIASGKNLIIEYEDGVIQRIALLSMHGLADTGVPSQTCSKYSLTVNEGDRSQQRRK